MVKMYIKDFEKDFEKYLEDNVIGEDWFKEINQLANIVDINSSEKEQIKSIFNLCEEKYNNEYEKLKKVFEYYINGITVELNDEHCELFDLLGVRRRDDEPGVYLKGKIIVPEKVGDKVEYKIYYLKIDPSHNSIALSKNYDERYNAVVASSLLNTMGVLCAKYNYVKRYREGYPFRSCTK